MTTQDFHDPHNPLQKIGSIALWCGILGGIVGCIDLLYFEVYRANKSVLAALWSDRDIMLSLVGTFILPTGIGYLVRLVLSQRDQY